ncbi:MAG TPA: histidinol dehydrogenase [Ignavibacteriaceae bacterium]|nr:histidinol dehydrogenase [Ignavibacteriaceae bacterium]
MKKYNLKNLSETQIKNLTRRKNLSSQSVQKSVNKILSDVKSKGLKSTLEYAKKFDGFSSREIFVTGQEFEEAEKILDSRTKNAILSAYRNIYKFHKKQNPENYLIETVKGVKCERKFIPIQNIGLYIPAGTAPLPSTMLMLGVPAQIAGCKRVVVASPTSDKIHPSILLAAKLCGINEFLKIGGAQAIALLAYGDKKFKKVDKIFGPGNQYVTQAKSLVSIDPDGCAIDMIAGPSEVLVIADKYANPSFIAADLLSQAEHGKDSLSILVTDSDVLFKKVSIELLKQLKKLPRKDFAKASLRNSYCLITNSLDEAFNFSNKFAPEHLIINLRDSKRLSKKVINAGSVFIGQYSPESAGDYASGTNHSLPTYGFAKSTGGVNVEMFMKAVTFQSISEQGLKNLSEIVVTLAETESLQAHANAVKVRLR